MTHDRGTVSVRQAKDRFSELVRRASSGERITIVSHGKPKALLSSAASAPAALSIDWDWLRGMSSRGGTPAVDMVREDRDGRD